VFIFLLLILQAEVKEGMTWIMAVYAIIGVLVALSSALLLILSQKRKDVMLLETQRANTAEGLIKLKDGELKIKADELDAIKKRNEDLEKKVVSLEEDLSDLSAEYKTLLGINIKELFFFWAHKVGHEAENRELKHTISVLEAQLKYRNENSKKG